MWSHRSSPGTLFWGMPALRGEVRRDRREQAGVAQQPEPDRRRRRAEQLVELGRDPLARQVRDQLGPCLDRRPASPPRPRSRASPPAGPRGPSGARPPRTGPAGRRPRGGSRPPRRHAPSYGSTSAGRLAGPRAPGHRVDREVAARQVELDRVAELDPVRSPEVGVVVVGPERRDLEDLAVAADGDRPEPVLVDGAREELDEPLGRASEARSQSSGRRPRSDVAQRAADDVGGVAGRPERLEQVADGGRDRVLDGGRPPPVSCDPGTGTCATPRCARRRGTA